MSQAPLAGLEERLADQRIDRLASPTPFPVGPVNVYLLADGPGVALVDTGVATPESRAALERALGQRNLGLSDITQVLATHGHVDHMGLAAEIARAADCPVYLHPRDHHQVQSADEATEHAQRETYLSYLIELGWAREVIERNLAFYARMRHLRQPCDDARPYPAPAVTVGEAVLRVIPTPGHSPGSVCLLDEREGWLYAGDTLLQHISPNPLLYLGDGTRAPAKFRSLAHFLESLDRLWDETACRAVLPGHGRPFRDHRARIAALRTETRRRHERVIHLMERFGRPISARDLAGKLFPRPDGIEAHLIASEVVGALEVIVDQGLAHQDPDEMRWSLA